MKKNPEIIYLATSKELEIANKLVREVGHLSSIVIFSCDYNFPTKFHDDIPSRDVAIREIIRSAALEKRCGLSRKSLFEDVSYKVIVGRDINNRKFFKGEIDDCPDKEIVQALLLPPVHKAYEWHDVVYWKLGNFHKLCGNVESSGCLIIPKVKVLLFSDEMKKLCRNETVTPVYWGGLGSGYIVDQLDTFSVKNDCLYRIKALMTD